MQFFVKAHKTKRLFLCSCYEKTFSKIWQKICRTVVSLLRPAQCDKI